LCSVFVVNLVGKIRNLGESKIGGVSIVIFIMTSVKMLERRAAKSYWTCARLSHAPFERVQGWANSATNASPVKRPVDWAVPDDGAHHATHMCDDLLSGTYVMPISSPRPAAGRV
jgi:hypothetical protein